MINRFTLLLFIGFAWGQQIDELETLDNYKERFLFQPENLYKSEEIWNSENSNEPFTGRLKIYSKNLNNYKVAECTIVDGLKNGNWTTYNKDGTVHVINKYKDDKLNGESKIFHISSGRKLFKTTLYENGIEKSFKYYDSEGNVKE